ncbi:MAG: LytR C-terminal domain-containing protein [Gaiellales bacterium]
MLAVGALAVAVGLLLWVLGGINSGSSSSSPSHTTAGSSTPTTPPPSSGTTKPKKHTIPWKSIQITVLNGYDPSLPAAGNAQTQLEQAGWTVAGIADTTTGTGTTATYVAYPPGQKAEAQVVAHRLHLTTKVVPIAQATGVPSTLTTVAVVLGPDNLPSGA